MSSKKTLRQILDASDKWFPAFMTALLTMLLRCAVSL